MFENRHIHIWRSKEVRLGLNDEERAFWRAHSAVEVKHVHRIVYMSCACGEVWIGRV